MQVETQGRTETLGFSSGMGVEVYHDRAVVVDWSPDGSGSAAIVRAIVASDMPVRDKIFALAAAQREISVAARDFVCTRLLPAVREPRPFTLRVRRATTTRVGRDAARLWDKALGVSDIQLACACRAVLGSHCAFLRKAIIVPHPEGDPEACAEISKRWCCGADWDSMTMTGLYTVKYRGHRYGLVEFHFRSQTLCQFTLTPRRDRPQDPRDADRIKMHARRLLKANGVSLTSVRRAVKELCAVDDAAAC